MTDPRCVRLVQPGRAGGSSSFPHRRRCLAGGLLQPEAKDVAESEGGQPEDSLAGKAKQVRGKPAKAQGHLRPLRA